jgi:hypothetical protein
VKNLERSEDISKFLFSTAHLENGPYFTKKNHPDIALKTGYRYNAPDARQLINVTALLEKHHRFLIL